MDESDGDGYSARVTSEKTFTLTEHQPPSSLGALARRVADELELAPQQAPSKELLERLFHSLAHHLQHPETPTAPVPARGPSRRDRRIARAQQRLEQDLAQRWTVDQLARAVGLSRPVLARRFIEALGCSPMRYLTQRRMQFAATLLLLDSERSLAEVAEQVGYQSEFAFSRAFKRHHGVAPGEYRRTVATVYRRSAPVMGLASLRCAA